MKLNNAYLCIKCICNRKSLQLELNVLDCHVSSNFPINTPEHASIDSEHKTMPGNSAGTVSVQNRFWYVMVQDMLILAGVISRRVDICHSIVHLQS